MLEAQLSGLKNVVQELKACQTFSETNKILEAIDVDNVAERSSSSEALPDDQEQSNVEPRGGLLCLASSSSLSMSYQGPTSIFRFGAAFGEGIDYSFLSPTSDGPLYLYVTGQDSDIDDILCSFFRWQYPEYMFINREAFLLDYMNYAYQGRYCSLQLVYAICALASLQSTNPLIKRKASTFRQLAYDSLGPLHQIPTGMTAVQALLCLAYLELGFGNVSSAWLLSGQSIDFILSRRL